MTGTLFSTQELEKLARKKEGQFLERKSLWDLESGHRTALPRRKVRDWIAEYVAAFANADGGTIVLGVDDDGTPTGHRYPEEAVKDFLEVPKRRLRPPVNVQTQLAELDGYPIIIMQVPFLPQAVMVEANGFPYRVGDEIVREPQEVINERKQAYRRVGYEQRIQAEVRVADLDLNLVQTFLGDAPLGDRNPEKLLEAYGLLVPRARGPAVTNAALLLFGRGSLIRWHPNVGIRFFRVAGTVRKHGTQRNVAQLSRIEGPLAQSIPQAQKFARDQIRRSEKLYSLFFKEMPEYPAFAWQEAIVNAFAHRNYDDTTRSIEVWFFEDRMEVVSPGGLIRPVTLEKLRNRVRVHASRNPLIARILVDADIMREEGEGIPRMHDEMEASFLHPPEFNTAGESLTVTLRNEPVFEGPSRVWKQLVDELHLSRRQQRVLLAYPDGFSNEDYRKVNDVDRDKAYQEIQDMVNLQLLLPATSPGRGAIYHIPPDLASRREWIKGHIPKLRAFFQAQQRLKNSDYRKMFGVNRYVATRELHQLTEDGFLLLKGERKGAHYVPGKALEVE